MKNFLLLCCVFIITGTAHAQLQNTGFETWDTSVSNNLYPHNWPLPVDGYYRQSAMAHSGNYALTTCIWYYYVKSSAIQQQPINYKPSSFDGYYMYTDNYIKNLQVQDTIVDTALVEVFLTKWNVGLSREDTIGRGILPLSQTASYTHFSCPVHYITADEPDSITVVLDPSMVRRYPDDPTYYITVDPGGYSSFFTVDDVSLQQAEAVQGVSQNETISVYPNPANELLNVIVPGNTKYNISITDAAGRLYSTVFANKALNALDIHSLMPGIYFLKLQDGDKVITKRFVKQ